MRYAPLLLRTARQLQGLTQADLARRADIPRSVLNAYERGKREPGAESLMALLAASAVDLRVTAARRPDPARADRIFQQVLDLAEALPGRRRAAQLRPSPFIRRLAS
jgi:transcriptional regulator with XRE-family HTH domain